MGSVRGLLGAGANALTTPRRRKRPAGGGLLVRGNCELNGAGQALGLAVNCRRRTCLRSVPTLAAWVSSAKYFARACRRTGAPASGMTSLTGYNTLRHEALSDATRLVGPASWFYLGRLPSGPCRAAGFPVETLPRRSGRRGRVQPGTAHRAEKSTRLRWTAGLYYYSKARSMTAVARLRAECAAGELRQLHSALLYGDRNAVVRDGRSPAVLAGNGIPRGVRRARVRLHRSSARPCRSPLRGRRRCRARQSATVA